MNHIHPLYLSDLQMALHSHNNADHIDLGLGHPDPTLLPVNAMQHAMTNALNIYGAEPLNYGWAGGVGLLVDRLRTRMGMREGRTPQPNEIMLTGGNSSALDQLLTLHAQPNDVVLVESPTYHLAVRIIQDHAVQMVPVPGDNDGPDVNALTHTLQHLKQQQKTVRFFYGVPTYSNPVGMSWSLARRQHMIDLAADEGFVLVEDDAYRELAYDEVAPPSLWSMDTHNVVARIGSFSKSLAAGLRLGWLTAPTKIIERNTNSGVLDSGGGVNPFTAHAVAQFFLEGGYDRQINLFKATYGARKEALVRALREYLPRGCSVSQPHGGFFVWVQLPNVNTTQLLTHAKNAGVSFIPGQKFFAHAQQGGGEHHLRLAFSLYAEDKLNEGARRLAQAVAVLDAI